MNRQIHPAREPPLRPKITFSTQVENLAFPTPVLQLQLGQAAPMKPTLPTLPYPTYDSMAT